MIEIPMWAFLLLIIGSVPTALVALAAIALGVLEIVCLISEERRN